MERDLRGIGEMARETGLTISALRFYDRAGLLTPAVVDPDTGYRRYAGSQVAPARVVAGLRRVAMPLAEIARVLAALPDTAAAHGLVDAHLGRLRDGLVHAERELSRVHRLLDCWEPTMTDHTTRVSVAAADLARSLDAVRFAVSGDAALPVLGGVLFAVTAGGLELVATDRYRLAVARAAAAVDGPPTRTVAPIAFVDDLRGRLDAAADPVVLRISGSELVGEVAGHPVTAVALPGEFPDHERLLDDRADSTGRQRVTFDVAVVRAALAPGGAPRVTRAHAGVPHPVTLLCVHPERGLTVIDPSRWDADNPDHVAVNPEFLLQALDAGGDGQLILDLDGPIRPLAIRAPHDPDRFSVLMPVRL